MPFDYPVRTVSVPRRSYYMQPISEKYYDHAMQMVKNAVYSGVVDENSVYQEANLKNRAIIDSIIDDLLQPGSRIVGIENLDKLAAESDAGASCLILMEHYSNFDIPCLFYLLKNGNDATRAISDRIVAMAGMKLNEDSPFVQAFAEAYTRIVIYPSRSLETVTDPKKRPDEQRRSNSLNRAALREMIRCKHNGKLVLMFPSGTRYRPGKPETKRGVKEVDSYVKSFDQMVLIGIAGSILRLHPSGEMSKDYIEHDRVVYTVGPIVSCRDFRDSVRESIQPGAEPKQAVADAIMAELEKLHEWSEQVRAGD